MIEAVERACAIGDTSVFVSGIDPGWALDILPMLVSGVSAGIEEIRVQEIFNYALYDAPDVVRDVIGFGGPMDTTPLMLLDIALEMVWAPMVRILAEALGLELDAVVTQVERRPLERTIEVPGMGTFEAGTQGAFRFEVQGIVDGQPAPGHGAHHPHRRRLRARLAVVDRAGRHPPGPHHRPPEPRRDHPRHRTGGTRRRGRRQRHRRQPHRQRHPRGVRRRRPVP